MKKEELIWKESNELYVTIFRIVFVFLFFFIIFLFSRRNEVMVLGIIGLIMCVIIFLPSFFKKRFGITKNGIVTGNDYKLSKTLSPAYYGSFLNYFKYPFKSPLFLEWKDIKEVLIKRMPRADDGLTYDYVTINTKNKGIIIVRILRLIEKESLEKILINKLGKEKINWDKNNPRFTNEALYENP